MEENNYYTMADIAKILGVSKQWVSRMVRDNAIKAYKFSGTYRIAKEDFENYIKESVKK
jgi:excisionase family DNA binding protein